MTSKTGKGGEGERTARSENRVSVLVRRLVVSGRYGQLLVDWIIAPGRTTGYSLFPPRLCVSVESVSLSLGTLSQLPFFLFLSKRLELVAATLQGERAINDGWIGSVASLVRCRSVCHPPLDGANGRR